MEIKLISDCTTTVEDGLSYLNYRSIFGKKIFFKGRLFYFNFILILNFDSSCSQYTRWSECLNVPYLRLQSHTFYFVFFLSNNVFVHVTLNCGCIFCQYMLSIYSNSKRSLPDKKTILQRVTISTE